MGISTWAAASTCAPSPYFGRDGNFPMALCPNEGDRASDSAHFVPRGRLVFGPSNCKKGGGQLGGAKKKMC